MISDVITLKGWKTTNPFWDVCAWAWFADISAIVKNLFQLILFSAFVGQQPWATIFWPTQCYRPVGEHLLTTPCWLKASLHRRLVSLTQQVSAACLVRFVYVHPWHITCLYTITLQALCFSNTMFTDPSVDLSACTYGCLCCVFFRLRSCQTDSLGWAKLSQTAPSLTSHLVRSWIFMKSATNWLGV